MELTNNEFKAIQNILLELAIGRGEDVIGVLMLYGCFRMLPGKELVDLAHKFDSDENGYIENRQKKIDENSGLDHEYMQRRRNL